MRFLPIISMLFGCYNGRLDDIHLELVEDNGWPDEWQYGSVCFGYSSSHCDEIGLDEAVDCTDDRTASCIVRGLDRVGREGWAVHLGDHEFPAWNSVYLMSKPIW